MNPDAKRLALEPGPSGPAYVRRTRRLGIDGTEVVEEESITLAGVRSRPMTIEELARVFGVGPKTMARRLADLRHERFGERVRVDLADLPPECLAEIVGHLRHSPEPARNAA